LLINHLVFQLAKLKTSVLLNEQRVKAGKIKLQDMGESAKIFLNIYLFGLSILSKINRRSAYPTSQSGIAHD
jgi:hypothetical protein